MMVARIGCQLAALFCSARAAGGCSGHSHWATALFGDLLAAALQLLHLPIGFQVRPPLRQIFLPSLKEKIANLRQIFLWAGVHGSCSYSPWHKVNLSHCIYPLRVI